jgi:NAD(P)-dependent dehydrogenase (short-subunit alcohol dehydrogenase family)
VFRQQIEINLIGQLAVTQATLPALRVASDAGKDARIVMIGSIGGRLEGPMLGPYHAAKFGLRSYRQPARGAGTIRRASGVDRARQHRNAIWRRGGAAAEELLKSLPPEAARYADQIEAAQANAAKTAARGIPPERAARFIVKALTDPRRGK